MKALLLHNPNAGMKTDKNDILAALQLADFDVRYVSTKDVDIETALKKSADLVVAAGGDGTIGKVLRSLPDRSIPVGLLPAGTANNIARSLGIAGRAHEVVESWKMDHWIPIDIGAVKAPWGTSQFVEAFGVGLFPLFFRMADKRKKPEGADNLLKGREWLQKTIKNADVVELDVKIDGKSVRGEFLGVEVMNTPFTGPGLPLATKAHVGDGLLNLICFEADQRKALIKWLDAPQDEPPPVIARQGAKIEIAWSDIPNRLDDQTFDHEGTRQIAELTCEPDQVKILMPVKHPAQVAHEAKASA